MPEMPYMATCNCRWLNDIAKHMDLVGVLVTHTRIYILVIQKMHMSEDQAEDIPEYLWLFSSLTTERNHAAGVVVVLSKKLMPYIDAAEAITDIPMWVVCMRSPRHT